MGMLDADAPTSFQMGAIDRSELTVRGQTRAVLIVSPRGHMYCRFADAAAGCGAPLALADGHADVLALAAPAKPFYVPPGDAYYTITLRVQFPGYAPHAEDMPSMRGPVPMDLMCSWVLRMVTRYLRDRTVRPSPRPPASVGPSARLFERLAWMDGDALVARAHVVGLRLLGEHVWAPVLAVEDC